MCSASPVTNMRRPSDRPPPKSRIVPQSIFEASFQPIVNRRSRQLTGSTNNKRRRHDRDDGFVEPTGKRLHPG